MGIKDLTPFLKKHSPESFVKIPAKEISKMRMAIDGHNWLFTYLGSVIKDKLNKIKNFEELTERVVFQGLLKVFLNFNVKLLNHKITPVWIWDGKSLPAKLETQEKRKEDRKKRLNERNKIKEELDKMSILERPTELIEKYKKMLSQTFYLPKTCIEELKDISRTIGLPTLTAISEGEKLACELAVNRLVACVWSSDTDTYAFGAPFVTKKVDSATGELIIEGVFTLSILKKLNMTHNEFRDFCIMCGCDFGTRAKGVGPVNSYKLIKKYGSIENIIDKEKLDLTSLNHIQCRKLLSPDDSQVKNIDINDLDIVHQEYDDDLDKYNLRSEFEIFISRTRNTPNVKIIPRCNFVIEE